ncbi:MAG: spermidine synthase [Opitutaceae bacterium]
MQVVDAEIPHSTDFDESIALAGMAIVWSQNIEGNFYEVRSAGATLRLYRNGVNHSQWNPNRPLSGSIWDLIVLPALYRPSGSVKDALVLGFGAGTVAAQLRELLAPERIVGLELDPMHLSIADGFFDCAEGCELIAADAVEWVHETDEVAQFDYILDDLYGEDDGIPVRCAPMDLEWCNRLAELVRPGGMLVFNLVEPRKVEHLPPFKDATLKARFPHTKVLKMEGYENRIVAFSEQPLEDEAFTAHLQRICKEYPRCYGVGKRYLTESS